MNSDHVDYVNCVIGALSMKTGKPCSVVYKHLKAAGLIEGYLVSAYEPLHTFSLEYVAEDLVHILKERGYDL